MSEPSEDILRRWLLGELPEGDAAPLEERLLEDDAFGARLREAENDLLDDLARGRLDARARDRAAERFAATPGDRLRRRIALAWARLESAPERNARFAHRRWGRAARGMHTRHRSAALAAALVATVTLVAVIAIGIRERSATTVPAVAELTISLMSDRTRGAPIHDVRVPAGVRQVLLQAEIDPEDRAVLYALRIDPGAPGAWVATDLAARRNGAYRFVETIVPAVRLAPGEHRVEITAGGREAGNWVVRVSPE